VHLVVEMDPQFGIHKLVKAIQGRSLRVLRQEFAWLWSRLPNLVDERVFRGHRRRGAAVGDHTFCGRSEGPVTDVGR
jgi:REP element-mobilizing transposase RayT